MLQKEKKIILSLGGSLIYPEKGININFLRKFDRFIRDRVKEGKQFFIVCGGGFVARKYQNASKKVIGSIKHNDVDWLGIHATRINAHLLRTIFRDIAHPKIITQYDEKEIIKEPVVIAAGWKPGWSTDYCAIKLAENYDSKIIVNLSNIETVYETDPRVNPQASPIWTTSWEYFRTLIEKKWTPGLSVPFDPVASELAQKLGLTVIILKGDDLKNLDNLFAGRKFKGTTITSLKPDGSFFNRFYSEKGKSKKSNGSDGWLNFYNPLRDFYRAVAIRLFLKPKSLLDVGCGEGRMVKYLRFLGVDAWGLDISKHLISRTSGELGKFLKQGDILNIPFANSSFEVVTTFDVLEHIPTENLPRAVSECNRVAQKLVLHKNYTSENWWIRHTHISDVSHVSLFTRNWWQKFWKEQGFSPAGVCYPSLPAFMETLFLLEKK